MSDSVFGYPGAKALMSDWIISHFPEHDLYVEPFGGSAAVLVNKEPSYNEIYNDLDSDIVHFFRVLRDDADALVEWCENTPFSRELHLKYAHEFYQGLRPTGDIDRAGRFFYLRNTQFAQKYTGVSGFRQSNQRNQAVEYQNRADALLDFRDRLRDVQIEHLDYGELVNRTDTADTLYYFDPPYVDAGDALYSHGEFDHGAFADVLDGIEGDWIVSYTELPDDLDSEYHVVSQERRGAMRAGVDDWEQTNTERLVMNFDPEQTPLFSGPEQSRLPSAVADGGESE